MDDLLAVHMPYLRTLAMRFNRECAAAGFGSDDLAQETLLRAIGQKDRLPVRESDRQRYLHRMMANLLHDRLDESRALKRGGGRLCSLEEMLEGMARSTLRLEGLLRAPGPGPRTVAQRREARERITAALELLPRQQRAAVTLHLVHELELEETAGVMKCTEGQVRGLVQRGRETLRAQLRDLWNQE
jgi:RNA polymerase sigma factor (sigma-70 family)